MKNFDYTAFKALLKERTKSAYLKCSDAVGTGNLAGFALYSDECAMTISVSYNTYAHLAEIREEEPGYDTYFRWAPGEWACEGFEEETFGDLDRTLREASLAIRGKRKMRKHTSAIFNLAVEVLEELRSERLFGGTTEDFVLVFAASDFSDPGMETEFARRLNAEDQAGEFAAWIESETADGDGAD